MSEKNLFTPSLNDEHQKTETYNISRLFYLAFFGGVIPLMVLGSESAKGLRISKNIIAGLIAAGCAILLAKMIAAALIIDNQLLMSSRTLRLIYRVLSGLLYLAYYLVMKERYITHVSLGGRIKPMLKPGLFWFFMAGLAEAFLIVGIGEPLAHILFSYK